MKTLISIFVGLLLTLQGLRPAHPCSGFTAHDGQTVLAGQNEDYYGESWQTGMETRIWFVPSEGGKYGCVAWGFANLYPQGGMNDQGLFWDGFATAEHTVDGTGVETFTIDTLVETMQVSATVSEAILYLRTFDLEPILGPAQLFFADRFGDSVVFDGSHVDEASGDFQVVTNWLFHYPELGAYPCWRYDVMTDMMENGLELTVDYFASIANAAHQGYLFDQIYTRYSTIGELNRGVFHLYYNLDYENPITFVLEDELAQGPHEYWMADLFTPDPGPDAGVMDVGVMDAGGEDAGPEPGPDAGDEGDDGSGGCSVAGGTDSPARAPLQIPLLVLVFLAGLVLRRGTELASVVGRDLAGDTMFSRRSTSRNRK